MSIGTYGSIRPSDVKVDDISIFYNYTASRETASNEMFSINALDVLTPLALPADQQVSGQENLLEGLYNLKLPATIFNALGIYTLYIKPTTINSTIVDCGVLAALPTTKGILINSNLLPEGLRANNALQGYKVEYINIDGTKLRNVVRYIVTSNKAVPISVNVGNTSQRAQRYTFDDTGNLLFIQLTPSSASDVKPNVTPFIGTAGQSILISNTFFSPLTVEIEMVQNTIDTIMNIVAGNQIKDVTNGILTYYDQNNQILRQFNLYELKDDVTNVPLYEIKEERDNIDETQDFDTITDSVGAV
jgi:hypothetical protein